MALHDYGPVTAYAWAVENGHFTGTLAEWVEMIGNVSDKAAAAVSAKNDAVAAKTLAVLSRSAAQTAEKNAEAWAKGTRGGTAVDSSDEAYHANAAYHAEQAAISAALAAASELVCTADAGAGHAPAIRATASGSVAHFADAVAAPMALDIVINPAQAGSGDPGPSNVRTISGRTTVTVSRSGADTNDADEYEIALPSGAGTVYGGTLHINQDGSGVLTVDRAITTVNDQSWTYNSGASQRRFAATFSDIKLYAAARTVPFTSSVFVSIDDGRALGDVPNNGIYGAGTSGIVYIKCTDYSTESAFKEAYGSAQIVYPIANPSTYTFTAAQISSLLGENNVWADTGDVTVEYTADTKTYVDAQAANYSVENSIAKSAVESIITSNRETSMTATKNYTAGDLVIVNDKLYKLANNVANGGSLTGNVIETQVEAQIKSVQAAIPTVPPVDSALSGSSTNPVQNKVVKGELDDLKSQINVLDYWQKKITSDGSNHSQATDNVTVDIKQGETFYIKTTTPNVFNCTPYAFYSDGTNESLGQTISNALCQYVAKKDITAIGVYIGPQGASYTFDIAIVLDGSALLNELANSEEAVKNEFQLNSIGLQTFYPYSRFANGGLKTTGLFEYAQPYRVSCINHITVTKPTTVHVKSGYRWGYIPFVNGAAGSWVGWKTSDYTIPANTEFVVQIAKTSEDTSIVGYVNDYVNALTFETEFGATLALKAHRYSGEKIPSRVHSFDSEHIFTMSYSDQVSQDIDTFGDYLFVAFSTVEQIKVYSLSDYSLVATLNVDTIHGSGMQFSNEYYDASDSFPLLYVGGWNTNLINVVRIVVFGNTWAATVVKTLFIPTTYGYFASPSIDAENNILYTYALHNNSVSDADPRILCSWDLNSLTDNGDDTYTPKLIAQNNSPYIGVYQGHKYYGGRIYMTISNTASPFDPKMVALDCGDGAVITTIDLSDFITSETEGLCYKIHDGVIDWYLSETKKVFKLSFN